MKSKSCAKDLVKDRCNCDCFVLLHEGYSILQRENTLPNSQKTEQFYSLLSYSKYSKKGTNNL